MWSLRNFLRNPSGSSFCWALSLLRHPSPQPTNTNCLHLILLQTHPTPSSRIYFEFSLEFLLPVYLDFIGAPGIVTSIYGSVIYLVFSVDNFGIFSHLNRLLWVLASFNPWPFYLIVSYNNFFILFYLFSVFLLDSH